MRANDGRRYHGEVIEWNGEKRCGFVRPRGSGPSDPVVFLPAAALVYRGREPKVGDVVSFETSEASDSPQNRRLRTKLRARQVVFEGEEPPPPPSAEYRVPPTKLGAAYLLAQGLAAFFFREVLWLFVPSLLFSILAFGQYAWDKASVKRGRRRIPESNLQLTAALGGWPGAALAQTRLRHKTQKRTFQNTFRAMIAINLILAAIALGYIAFVLIMPRIA